MNDRQFRAGFREPATASPAPNYTMLDNLKTVLDDLEARDAWAHNFVQDLLIRREEGRLGRLTDKQFSKLLEIHERFYGRKP